METIPRDQQSDLAGSTATPKAHSERLTRWALLIAAITLVCAVVSRDIRTGEFDYNVDEAQHAVTGLFVADFFRDHPLRHPVEYAYEYYAQYPAVAIVHWPPLFYLFEGVSFLVLGPTVFAARLTVLLFVVLLLYQWFKLVEHWQDSYTAAICTAGLGLLPMVLLFEKTVMLEIPSLALSVATIRYWIRYLEDGENSSLYWAMLWLSAALLCKQTSVFIFAFCVLTLLVTGQWRRIRLKAAFTAVGIVAVLAGPFLVLMFVVQGKAVATDLGSHGLTGLARFSYFSEALPHFFPAILLVLALAGLALAFHWDTPRHTTIMGCWVVSAYLTFSCFGQPEERFAIYWLPPLVYFAVGLLTQSFQQFSPRAAMRLAAAFLVVTLAVPAWHQRRPYIAGYKNVAAQLINDHHSGIVLFDGPVPGNFVFFMRALDPARRFVTLRKLLYADNIRPGVASEELLHNQADLSNAFQQYGVRFVVVSQNLAVRFESQRLLREQLAGDDFKLEGKFAVVSNEPKWKGENLLLYEKKQWTPPTGQTVKVRMLTMPHDIEVPAWALQR
jgi:hypothetical protein